jgi:hypothetical protein
MQLGKTHQGSLIERNFLNCKPFIGKNSENHSEFAQQSKLRGGPRRRQRWLSEIIALRQKIVKI